MRCAAVQGDVGQAEYSQCRKQEAEARCLRTMRSAFFFTQKGSFGSNLEDPQLGMYRPSSDVR